MARRAAGYRGQRRAKSNTTSRARGKSTGAKSRSSGVATPNAKALERANPNASFKRAVSPSTSSPGVTAGGRGSALPKESTSGITAGTRGSTSSTRSTATTPVQPRTDLIGATRSSTFGSTGTLDEEIRRRMSTTKGTASRR